MEKKEYPLKVKVVSALFLLFIVGGAGYWLFSPSNPVEKKERSDIEVMTMAQQFVKKKLKAPSTAEFSPSNETEIKKLNDSTYEVLGYVDAQNTFGAQIRSTYYCKMRYEPGDMVAPLECWIK